MRLRRLFLAFATAIAGAALVAHRAVAFERVAIGNQFYNFAGEVIKIDEKGKMFVGLDILKRIDAKIDFDAVNKTVHVSANQREMLIDLRTQTLAYENEKPRGGLMVLVGGKAYVSSDVLDRIGYRLVFEPELRVFRVIGKVGRVAYGADSKDFVVESYLPVSLEHSQDLSKHAIEIKFHGSFVLRERTEKYASTDLNSVDISNLPGEDTVRMILSQTVSTGYKVYFSRDMRTVRVNLRNHFQLADYEKTSSGEIRLKVQFGKRTTFKAWYLKNPYRLVLDFDDAIYDERTMKVPVNVGNVDGIRIGQFSTNPYVVRVVVDMKKKLGYRIVSSPDGDVHYVQLLEHAAKHYVVMLDPGHGGSDTGAPGVTGTLEKDVTLSVAQTTRDALTQMGYKVLMTREGDEFVSLAERAAYANSALPFIYVSIHANSVPDSNISGAMVFHYQGSVEGSRIARYVLRSIVSGTGAGDKGVRIADFYVLREVVVPSVLIEMGFLTNPAEEARLKDAAYQATMGKAIADGIDKYLEWAGEHNVSESTPPPAMPEAPPTSPPSQQEPPRDGNG
jgi:N-acetylmuramoyl-L-alanine amidase CwlD